MPIYESRCGICGLVYDYYQTSANCHDTPNCCGRKTTKVILTPPSGIVDIPAYQSPIDGRVINSRSQRRDDLKRHGCREWEGLEQEKKVADSERAHLDKVADAQAEEAAVAAWHGLSEEKRKTLEQS